MNLEITDEEVAALKARIIAAAETRMTTELVDSMRREVTREALVDVRARARSLLKEAVVAAIEGGAIQRAVESELELMRKVNYGSDNLFRQELTNAVLRVTQAHAEAVSKQISNLLYVALRHGFYEKAAEGEAK